MIFEGIPGRISGKTDEPSEGFSWNNPRIASEVFAAGRIFGKVSEPNKWMNFWKNHRINVYMNPK